MLKDLLDRVAVYFQNTNKMMDDLSCAVPRPTYFNSYLLFAILATLRELVENSTPLGMVYTRQVAVQLTTTPVRIFAKEEQGRLRSIAIGIDSAAGGPTPTIRFGSSAVSALTGGIRLNAGVLTELGELAPDTELWAASSTPIAAYTLERA
jgi:hypothetical protein